MRLPLDAPWPHIVWCSYQTFALQGVSEGEGCGSRFTGWSVAPPVIAATWPSG